MITKEMREQAKAIRELDRQIETLEKKSERLDGKFWALVDREQAKLNKQAEPLRAKLKKFGTAHKDAKLWQKELSKLEKKSDDLDFADDLLSR